MIVDPYIGSGTTAVAAKLMGYDYIGIDTDADYVGLSKNRLNNADMEINLLKEELDLHKVSMSFAERKKMGLLWGGTELTLSRQK